MKPLKCISADSHVIEPPDLWTNYIEPKFKDRAPHCEREDGKDIFKCDGVDLIQVGALSGAGRSIEKLQSKGSYEEDVPPGSYDPKPRVDEMAIDGVEAEVLYPSVALRMYALPDSEYQLACFQAYNKWMADFCKQYPDNFRGIGLVPIDDIETAVGEVKHCAKLGLAGVSIALIADENRTYDNPMYEPLWIAAEEHDLPISLHILTERRQKPVAKGVDSIAAQITVVSAIQDALARLIFSGVLRNHPNLKIVSAENDIGWAAYFCERADYLFDRRRAFHKFAIPQDTLPSEYFKRQCYLTFMRDRSGILARSVTGVDNLMWSSDYPHQDSTWPDSQAMIQRLVGDIPEDEAHKIIAGNVAQLYNFN